jgi:hypothetical protein
MKHHPSPAELIEAHERRVEEINVDEDLIELAEGETSLDFLRKVYRSARQPMSRRMRAAIEALQHEHPRLQAIATTNMIGKDFAAALERAIQRSLAGKPTKLIEAQAIEVDESR